MTVISLVDSILLKLNGTLALGIGGMGGHLIGYLEIDPAQAECLSVSCVESTHRLLINEIAQLTI